MKRLTLLTMLATLLSVAAFAQKGLGLHKLEPIKSPVTAIKCLSRQAQPAASAARRAAGELVTPPATATAEPWYLVDGTLYVNTQSGQQAMTKNISVAFDGADVYIQGLAYWFPEGWVKGTVAGNVVTIPGGQFVGEDEYGAEWICGSSDGKTLSESILFAYDAENGSLTAATPYILENSTTTEIAPYCYWVLPVFSKTQPDSAKPVEAPEGLKTDEWAISATTNYGDPVFGYVNIGFDGSDVYLQGLCTYLPEVWIKGTLEGNTITFPGDQYFGGYDADSYTHYEFYLRSEPVVFTYDAEAGKMTAEGEVYIREAIRNYKGDVYNNPVLTKVVERAGTPATPSISQIYDGTQGPIAMFAIPTVDVDGNAMTSSKLSFQLLKDIEQEVSAVTFDPADYEVLTESMSVLPYGYTNGADFQPEYILLRHKDYGTWNKIGIQSTYTGGGEEHKSEIFWLTLKEYQKMGFNFNLMTDEPCSSNLSNEGDITVDRTFEANGVKLTVSPNPEGTPNRFWNTSKGPQLRVYGGTLTFEAPKGKVLTRMVFNNGKWNNNNSADTGSFDGNTWTGEAQKVVVTIAGNTQLNSIDIYPADYVAQPVVAPEGLVTDTYIFKAHSEKEYYDPAELTLWVKAGFDGDDVYIQGLAADYNSSVAELWVKATKNAAGQYVIPANQFMGAVSFWMSNIECYFTAVDAEDKMVDAVFDYDPATSQFTSSQTLVLNAMAADLYPYQKFSNVTITKFNEVAATPANPSAISLNFDEYTHAFSCSIPSTTADGALLNPQKLFYTVWIDANGEQAPYLFTAEKYYGFEADATEVPYSMNYNTWDGTHSIYFYDDAPVYDSWKRVGIQSLYYGGGETRKSEIVWIENPAYVPADVEIGKDCYATFFDATHSFAIPEGVKAYVVTAATTEQLTYEELQDVIPAGTAVMLKAPAAGVYPMTVGDAEVAYEGVNLLHGSNVATVTTADGFDFLHYKLAYGHSASANANKLGWYWGAEDGAAFQIEAHRAWLSIPQDVAAAPGYPFVADFTGIRNTVAEQGASNAYYDLMGRRVSTPAKGLYIHNHKKVIIK